MPFLLADSLASDFGAERVAISSPGLVSVVGLEGITGSGEGALAPPRPGDSLPCQYSNNSNEEPPKLSPYQRKNAYSLNENLANLVEVFGIGRIGFLTLTFPKDLTVEEANRRFNSLRVRVLEVHFVTWVRVLEFTKGGRPHFHLIVVCRVDIRDGFNFENLTRLAYLTARPERRRKFSAEIKTLSRSLNPCDGLRALWAEFRRVLPLYQFGRHELTPVRKSGAALARYVGGYIRKSMEFRPVDAKGSRLVTYARSFPRKVVGHAWSFNSPGAEHQRAKRAVFAKLHGIKDLDKMKSRFGPRWAWWLNDLISSINLVPSLSCAPSYEQAGAALARYVNGPENEAFCLAMDSGVNMLAMHLRRPELPLMNGVPVEPPRRLRAIFGFHLENWNKTADQIAAVSASNRRRMADLRSFGRVNFTEEALQAARVRLLAAPVVSDAAKRAANYFRIRFAHLSPEIS